MSTLSPNVLIASIVLPIFYLAVYVDYAASRAQGRGNYELKDTLASLGVSIMDSALSVMTLGLRIAIYTFVYNSIALGQWTTSSAWTWVIGLLLYDFTYYWQHRMGHELNILWCSHVVHHSSDRFNLSTALRVPTVTMHLWTWIFALPLALIGIPPMVYAVAALLNLLYQFWIHTERIGKLGAFDRWFGSPSNHRVHHAVNDRYIDKNYGGILMIWDRLFDTYEDERDDDKVVFGTRAPVRSWNPLWINIDTFWSVLKTSLGARRWRDKLQVWLRPPGWRPADPAAHTAAGKPKPSFDSAAQTHYDTRVSKAVGLYCAAQTAFLPMQLVHLIATQADLAWFVKLIYALYLGLSALSLGLLISPRVTNVRRGLLLELLRLIVPAAMVATSGTWFAGLHLSFSAALTIMAVTTASLVALMSLVVTPTPSAKLRPSGSGSASAQA